jgi:hypothetical protein
MSLHSRNPADSLVRGQSMGGLFSLHLVDSNGPPMIHLSRLRRAEIVVFGQQVQLRAPAFLYAGEQIMLKGDGSGRIKVMRFAAREEDREIVCSPQLDDVIRAIVELGGGYADVMQFLHEAKNKNDLDARIVVDALPSGGRTFRRGKGEEASEQDADTTQPRLASPLPDLFDNSPSASGRGLGAEDELPLDVAAPEEQSPGWWSRLGSWFAGG